MGALQGWSSYLHSQQPERRHPSQVQTMSHFDTELEFVDFLFKKLVDNCDMDMIDLQEDDTTCDHLNFEQLTLF